MWQAFVASVRLNFLHKFLRVEQVVRNAAWQVPWMMMRCWMKLCVQTKNDLRHHGSTSIPLVLLHVAGHFSQECLAFSAKKLFGNTLNFLNGRAFRQQTLKRKAFQYETSKYVFPHLLLLVYIVQIFGHWIVHPRIILVLGAQEVQTVWSSSDK